MKYLYLLLLSFLLSAQVVLANPPAGKGNAGFGMVAGGPPGLKGKTPAGKIPHGWTEGKKTGWSKTQHSLDHDNDHGKK